MRRIARVGLSSRTQRWLDKNRDQLVADPAIKINPRWSARRKTMNNNGVVDTLKRMAGYRYRCMYCGDSEGCDVEHFFPKSEVRWRRKVFEWNNFLWICAPCNRLKNAIFQVDGRGRALLLNPSSDHLWEFFDYIEESGQLVARFDLDVARSGRANRTLDDSVTRLLHEVVCDGRQRSSRIIRRAMRAYSESDQSEADGEEFISHVIDAGYPELCSWYFEEMGSRSDPFLSFVNAHGLLLSELRTRLNALYPQVWPDA